MRASPSSATTRLRTVRLLCVLAPAALVLALLGAVPAVASSPPVVAKAGTGHGFVTMVSESGDWVGQGTSRIWRTPHDSVTVSGGSGFVGVGVSGSGGDFTLDFAAPSGKRLKAGSYLDAQRYPFESSGRPGLDISGDGRGCNEVSGRFWVLDLSRDRSRVWIVYEEHCEGGRPAVFGEVRIGEPDQGGVQMAPSRVRWPDDYPNVALRPVPIHVVNRGSIPLTVTGASVVAGGADFSVEGNTCGTVPVGSDCTVYVGFTASIRGNRLGELRLRTSAGTRWVPLAGHGAAGRTSWQMSSQPGDWVGGGQDYSFTPEDGANISGGGSETHAWARVTTGSDDFDADFEAASGKLLLPGTTFPNATRYPFNNGGAGLSITGNGAGCNEVNGSFTVEDSSFSDNGALTSYLIDFEQWCDNSSSALTGTIAWRAADPSAPPLDTSAPYRVTSLGGAVDSHGKLHLHWTNPGNADWVDTVVRVATGTEAPRSYTGGRELSTGRGTTMHAHLSPTHRTYSIAVFSRDTSGNSTRTTLTVHVPH
jgi:hypothetical protein